MFDPTKKRRRAYEIGAFENKLIENKVNLIISIQKFAFKFYLSMKLKTHYISHINNKNNQQQQQQQTRCLFIQEKNTI
jgi:hypothetical protein